MTALTTDTPGTPENPTSTPRTVREPSVWRLCLSRGGVELRQFFRERTAVIFTFALPVVLLILLGAIFDKQMAATGIPSSQLLAAGMIAAGIGSTCFVNLATSITSDREDGTLKRLRGVPMPPIAYFVGKIILVLVTAVVEVAIVLAIATIFYDLPLPTDVGRWVTFAWVFLLGVTGCSLLGTAMSSVPRSVRAAAPIVNLPFLILQFVSGIFIVPITTLPQVLQQIGAVFPLKWMAQGFRSVFLPDAVAAMEPAGVWEHGRIALVLAAWCLGGLILCLTTFRWQGRKDG
ncbi:ABC transporter permease [Streptosporangium sp. 'caverna']|uniref:Transport permease protein n=2 Tax=unclassified Streptosporangium TaxID=2632669 RepID=A0A2U9KCY3_9ACTN|nr:ABC transporter permease [Streptosporangium sp. 'caverna']AWS27339.1 FunT2 [Streptosporangium sp. KD35]AWS45598.1 ABC transporter [Streptosporangium sp. 'caverna']AXI91560.1 FunT2 [Streptosporangium sp.]